MASIALLLLGACGAYAQRRGAFIAGPPNAGRPVVPAVTGTPGALPWNPGTAGSSPCCFGPGRNQWRGHDHSREREGGPGIIAVPVVVPLVEGGETGQEPISDQAAPPPEPQSLPIVITAPPIGPAAPPPSPPAEAVENRPARPAPPDPPHVLIAMKDGWVYAAMAYWVDGGTLHYVSLHGDHDQVSLQLVDREISARLNRTSEIKLVLP